MSEYVITPLAKADIFAIWSHIAEDSLSAADSVEEAIFDACSIIGELRLAAIFVPTLRLVHFVFGHSAGIRTT